jgi:hypothetical protein
MSYHPFRPLLPRGKRLTFSRKLGLYLMCSVAHLTWVSTRQLPIWFNRELIICYHSHRDQEFQTCLQDKLLQMVRLRMSFTRIIEKNQLNRSTYLDNTIKVDLSPLAQKKLYLISLQLEYKKRNNSLSFKVASETKRSRPLSPSNPSPKSPIAARPEFS